MPGFLNKVKAALCLGQAAATLEQQQPTPSPTTCQAAVLRLDLGAQDQQQRQKTFYTAHERLQQEVELLTAEAAPIPGSAAAEQQELAELLARFIGRNSSRDVADELMSRCYPAAAATASAADHHLSTFSQSDNNQFDWALALDQATKTAAPPSITSFFNHLPSRTCIQISGLSDDGSSSNASSCTTYSQASASSSCKAAQKLFCPTASSGIMVTEWGSLSKGHSCNRRTTSSKALLQLASSTNSPEPRGLAERPAPTSRLFRQSSNNWVMGA